MQMLRTAIGEDSLSQAVVYQWDRRFKGRDAFKDDPRSGRPSTARNEEIIAKVKEKSRVDWRLTIREISKEIDSSFGSYQAILTEDLGMRRVVAKFVPRLFKKKKKFSLINICKEL